MQFIVYAIIPLVVALLLPLFSVMSRKNIAKKEKKLPKQEFVMRASKLFCVLLIMLTLIFVLSIVLLNIYDDVTLIANLALYAIEIFLIWGCILSVRQKIYVGKDTITYTPTFGKTKEYKYEEITKVVGKLYTNGFIGYTVYSEKAIFRFSNQAVGCNVLLNKLKAKGIEILIKE